MSAATRDFWLAATRETRARLELVRHKQRELAADAAKLEDEIAGQLSNAQGECPKHEDDGGFMYGFCKHCGAPL